MDHIKSKIVISASYSDIDKDFVIDELQKTYWANSRSKEMILLSLSHSLCYSGFIENKQIGFMRIVTDYSTIAYLCDVIIAEEFQSLGIAQKMLSEIFANPELKSVNWMLRTKDAHGLYQKFGFTPTTRPERYMERSQVLI